MMMTGKARFGFMLLMLMVVMPVRAEDRSLPDQVKDILSKATEVSLVSLEPSEKANKDNALHGWKVLGQTSLKDAEIRKKLLATLEKGIADTGNVGIKCFDPRHAIRAKHDGKTVDLLICFECGWVYTYVDGKKTAQIIFDRVGQKVFDDVLRKADVPLAKK
jgi:hypothetical protein